MNICQQSNYTNYKERSPFSQVTIPIHPAHNNGTIQCEDKIASKPRKGVRIQALREVNAKSNQPHTPAHTDINDNNGATDVTQASGPLARTMDLCSLLLFSLSSSNEIAYG